MENERVYSYRRRKKTKYQHREGNVIEEKINKKGGIREEQESKTERKEKKKRRKGNNVKAEKGN